VVDASFGDAAPDGSPDAPPDAPPDVPPVPGTVSLSPPAVAHGLVRIGELIGATLTVSNTSPTAAPLDSIAITGTGFTMTTTCGATLPPASDCTIAVAITAQALVEYAATVTVTSAGAPHAVPLSATGAWQLTIEQAGIGGGTITPSPSGVACDATCSQLFAGDVVLTVAPDAGTKLESWSMPGCSGLTCAVPAVLGGRTVTARFAAVARQIQVTREGSGRITSSPAGIDCGATCSYEHVGEVTLTATPFLGQTFEGWSELSCGTSATCEIPMGSDPVNITGRFSAGPIAGLDIEIAGGAEGEVLVYQADSLVGRCTSSCSLAVPAGALVIAAATTFQFESLTGTGCVADGDRCEITPSGSAQITATFRRDPKDRWTFVGNVGEEFTKGAFDAAGNLIAGSQQRVVKLGPTGTLLWERAPTGGEILVAPSGVIYVTDARGTVKLDPAGSELWVRPGGPTALDVAGNVLVVDYATGSARMTLYQPDGTPLWTAPGSGTEIDGTGTIYDPFTQLEWNELDDHPHKILYAHRYDAIGAPLADTGRLGLVEEWGDFGFAVTANRRAVLERDDYDYRMLRLVVTDVATGELTHYVDTWRLGNVPIIPDGFITGGGDDIAYVHDPDEGDVYFFGGYGYQLERLAADGTIWTLKRFLPRTDNRTTYYGLHSAGVAAGPGGHIAMLGHHRPFYLQGMPRRPDVGIIQAFAR
jgi:hypothetical protein